MSSITSSIRQHFKHIYWFSKFYLMKWCCNSICLVPKRCVKFFASAMNLLLSHMMDFGYSCTYSTSTKSCQSHTIFFRTMASNHVLHALGDCLSLYKTLLSLHTRFFSLLLCNTLVDAYKFPPPISHQDHHFHIHLVDLPIQDHLWVFI